MIKTAQETPETQSLMKRAGHYVYATGKRKTSVAKVRLYNNGKGEITINNRPLDDYFFGILIGNVLWPLKLAKMEKSFDAVVKVTGGGVNSQADAVRHGLAKALTVFDPALRTLLKKVGLISRDARIKERKKPGLKRARRGPQWAKR